MTITSAIVLLSVYWFIILFIILPINVTTQNDERNIIEGTTFIPVNPNLKRKFSITTIVSIILDTNLFGNQSILLNEFIDRIIIFNLSSSNCSIVRFLGDPSRGPLLFGS